MYHVVLFPLVVKISLWVVHVNDSLVERADDAFSVEKLCPGQRGLANGSEIVYDEAKNDVDDDEYHCYIECKLEHKTKQEVFMVSSEVHMNQEVSNSATCSQPLGEDDKACKTANEQK
jgi:hypothetical protein